MYFYKSGCVFEKLSDIKGKKITVMGLGLNGGGEAAVRFFAKHGAHVTVTDMKSAEELSPTIEKLKDLEDRITYVLGEHRISDFENADCVIKNPGVKIEGNKYLSAAKNIETDISVFLHFSKSPLIAVTGSKGKSSTVSAIHYGLREAGIKSFLGGNITVSPLSFLEDTDEKTPVVLELSSWQLADLRGRNVLKPRIALITKIVPDHQNWYGNMESYVADKKLIYENQDENDFTILDADGDEEAFKPENASLWGEIFASETKAKVLRYSRHSPFSSGGNSFFGVWEDFSSGGFEGKLLLPGMEKPVTILEKLSVPGKHIRSNALNAALVLYLMGIEKDRIKNILSGWKGVEHRLQYFFKTENNIRFFNDSCSTVPEATVAAAESFENPVVLIAGGTDKGLSFEPLVDFLDSRKNESLPKAVFLLSGSGTEKIISGLEKNKTEYEGPFENLDALLVSLKKYIAEKKLSDQTVVFSPGATSFGLFKNEFDRGNRFMEKVKEIFCQ